MGEVYRAGTGFWRRPEPPLVDPTGGEGRSRGSRRGPRLLQLSGFSWARTSSAGRDSSSRTSSESSRTTREAAVSRSRSAAWTTTDCPTSTIWTCGWRRRSASAGESASPAPSIASTSSIAERCSSGSREPADTTCRGHPPSSRIHRFTRSRRFRGPSARVCGFRFRGAPSSSAAQRIPSTR